MLEPLRKLILAITIRGGAKRQYDDARKLAVLAIKAKDKLPEFLEGMADVAERFSAETKSWVLPDSLERGEGGKFDACDLRCWLALSARSGVPAVPAREILSLTDEEMDFASGKVDVSPTLRSRLAAAVTKYFPGAENIKTDRPTIDPEAVTEKIFAAMDDVPEGWMVRHVRAGPESLKAIAGVGAAGATVPEVRINQDLEFGPGWIRLGNRRRVDTQDSRIVMAAAQAPENGPCVFVARPWVKAARWAVADDPHRHNSKLAGKGIWPCEWRAFVERGRVTGVSFYYAWAGEISAENATAALRVRDLAQKVADEATRQNAIPMFMDIEFERARRPGEFDERWPVGSIAFTLDFIETEEGILMLEGGPAFGPFPGGHPCGFAGAARADGVAFRVMDGVLLGELKTWADPRTWGTKDPKGAILPWPEVEKLAESGAHDAHA